FLESDRGSRRASLRRPGPARNFRFVRGTVRCPRQCRSSLSVECRAGRAASPPTSLLPAHARPVRESSGCRLAATAHPKIRARVAWRFPDTPSANFPGELPGRAERDRQRLDLTLYQPKSILLLIGVDDDNLPRAAPERTIPEQRLGLNLVNGCRVPTFVGCLI